MATYCRHPYSTPCAILCQPAFWWVNSAERRWSIFRERRRVRLVFVVARCVAHMTSGQYYIQGGYIYGPKMSGLFYIRGGYIYGPKNNGKYYIQNDCIYGPDEELPWMKD